MTLLVFFCLTGVSAQAKAYPSLEKNQMPADNAAGIVEKFSQLILLEATKLGVIAPQPVQYGGNQSKPPSGESTTADKLKNKKPITQRSTSSGTTGWNVPKPERAQRPPREPVNPLDKNTPEMATSRL